MDWVTLAISLIVGLGGGVAGALIGSAAQRKVALGSARREAAHALWNFHRVLHDHAAEWESGMLPEEARDYGFTKITVADIVASRITAYPYRHYLGADSTELVTRLYFPIMGDAMDPRSGPDGVWNWAQQLETRLNEVFGKDPI